MEIFVVLLLARYIQMLYRAFEPGVGDLSVNDRGAYPFMPECSLGESEVAGLFINSESEQMTHRMNRIPTDDTSLFEPVRETQLHLTGSDSSSSLGEKEGIGLFGRMVFKVRLEHSFELPVEKHELLDAVFPFDAKCPLGEVDIFYVKGDERSEADAGTQENREHERISVGDGRLGSSESSKQRANFFVGHDRWWSSAVAGHANEPGGILFQVPAIHKESEKAPQDGLRPVERHHRFGASVCFAGEGFRCQEAS